MHSLAKSKVKMVSKIKIYFVCFQQKNCEVKNLHFVCSFSSFLQKKTYPSFTPSYALPAKSQSGQYINPNPVRLAANTTEQACY